MEAKTIVTEERLREADARVKEACGMLQAGSAFRMEASLAVLDSARGLLAGAAVHGADERAAAGELAGSLALARALAREAAMFYRECAWPGSAGACTYGRAGAPLPDVPAARILAEI